MQIRKLTAMKSRRTKYELSLHDTGIDIQVLMSLERLNPTSDLIYLHGQSRQDIVESMWAGVCLDEKTIIDDGCWQ